VRRAWHRYRGRMPELPEVETVRRMLASTVLGRRVAGVRLSRKPLRDRVPRELIAGLPGRRFVSARRHGKFLLLDLDDGWTLLSHLGMSGRWLYHERPPRRPPPHTHVRIAFEDGSALWFEDPRRFGMARLVHGGSLGEDPSLRRLGPDPIAEPPTGRSLAARARGSRVAIKVWLLDQSRIAGIGNIYASEIAHRAGIDPRRSVARLTPADWNRIARHTRAVLAEAIDGLGTTFSTYRTMWGEPGQYGERLRVYDRAGEPCPACGSAIRQLVQAQRSTFFCPACQPSRKGLART
jgi:formamidopyrimidine-DNA glycosylase